ncbi:hypothetical protein PG993_006894 [Apiospora rasikravindrae]|uniref:Uncharacterized protein n=1 Tax=Apiospora rasikravindrae TaxID=990691 RepID=A0ABR1SVZ1_9PEZI
MKCHSLLLFALLPIVTQASGRDTDNQVLAQYETLGQCFFYLGYKRKGDDEVEHCDTCTNTEKSSRPCVGWCKKQGKSADTGCHSLMPTLEETDPAFQKFDDDGFLHNIGKCFCTEDLKPILDPIINAIADALQKLGDILEKICEGLLETVKQVVDVGITAIPGGSAVKAVSWGVRAAKTLVENGKTAEDMFGNWVGPVCGDASFKGFDIATAFQQFSEAPDSMGTSTGCFNKKGCKRLPPKKDPPKAPKKPDDPPEKPTTNVPEKPVPTDKPTNTDNKPTATDKMSPIVSNNKPPGTDKPTATYKQPPTTTENSPATTTTNNPTSTSTKSDSDDCKINKRAADDNFVPKQKLGDAEQSLDCKAKPRTMHITETKQPIGSFRVIHPQTCPRKFAQACYHYSSVMRIHAATKSMTEFACAETRSGYRDYKDLKADALAQWGSTAIVKRAAKHQHYWPWAQGWIPRAGEDRDQGECQRDEWPPAYFWPGDVYAKRNNMESAAQPQGTQWGAGAIFNRFCWTHDAMRTRNSQETFENRNNVETVGRPDVKAAKKGANGIMTITTVVSVNTRHAIFKFEDWDNLPVDNVWYGLRDNPCWPSDLAKDDPGWALLTNDEFYETQHQNLKQFRELYTKPPPLQDLKDALLKRGGSPRIHSARLKRTSTKTKSFISRPGSCITSPTTTWLNDTEDEPGNHPLIEKRREKIDMINIKKMTIEDVHRTEDEDLEHMDDAQVDAWMDRYIELLRKQSETSSNTSPPVSDAQPTPAGQADPTPAAASVGSLGFGELPQPTTS